ncbi:phenylacetate--CoA ligase family protein [Candidatus Bipolaricaulota bacterium]|nr:phenylacetate--CoA ligase family protein [Candidatus Bipolaricaulota bacterium]
MNPFMNPVFLLRAAKGYLTDIDRVWKTSYEGIERYRNKQFRKIVRYAYDVPVYRKKYREAGIHPDDIKGIEDIKKLPFITKDDFRKSFPDGIVHPSFDIKKAHLVSTSGSTGQPVSIYTDTYTIIKALFGFLRELKEYDVNWRKTRMSIIADVAPHAVEETYLRGSVMPAIRKVLFLKNLQILHVGEEPEELMKKIDKFNPEFLGGYPGILRALAVLKRQGYGKNVNPKVMSSSGAVLDDYTKKYIEDAFNAKIYDVYGSTEAGPVAFECKKGNYHIHSDMVHLEFLDEDGNDVAPGEPGHVVITKLYGRGTPVIRYTGMNDILIPLDKKCDCGINTEIIGRVEGRRADAIILPDGRIIPPLSITGIPGEVMKKLDTNKIKQFQIIQESPTELNVLIVVDEELRNTGPSIEKIFEEIKNECTKKLGDEIEVNVMEVESIESRGDLPPSVVISKVDG